MAITISGSGTITGLSAGGLPSGSVTSDTIAANTIESGDLATAVQPIGVGQTWQDFTGSRALGVTYTNSTGRTIFFMVTVGQNSSGVGTNGAIGGLSINTHQDNGSASTGCFFGVVPNGGTYGPISVETGKTMNTWLELR